VTISLTQKSKIMVKVIGYKQREREDGTSFFVLEIDGGLDIIRSSSSGQFYATSKKTTIPSTFSEVQCEALIGTEINGSIVKKECVPYKYVVKETGEEIMLHHRWVYSPDEDVKPKQELESETIPLAGDFSFRKNGSLELA
jgi:hypothetical protein